MNLLFHFINLVPHYMAQYNTHYIDEVTIPFKGRLGFKQYLKDKPMKWGHKSVYFGRCVQWLCKNFANVLESGLRLVKWLRKKNDFLILTFTHR